MKAHLRSVRIAPKKANLIAQLVRGMPVSDALESLKRTHKKGARLIEELLRSAVANAEHNDKQDISGLVIKTIVVNQGTAYRRGVPKARGSVRPVKKFLSHISLTLGLTEGTDSKEKGEKGKKASQSAPKSVKKTQSSSRVQKASAKKSSDASAAPVSSASKTSEESAGSASSAS